MLLSRCMGRPHFRNHKPFTLRTFHCRRWCATSLISTLWISNSIKCIHCYLCNRIQWRKKVALRVCVRARQLSRRRVKSFVLDLLYRTVDAKPLIFCCVIAIQLISFDVYTSRSSRLFILSCFRSFFFFTIAKMQRAFDPNWIGITNCHRTAVGLRPWSWHRRQQ